MTAVKREDGGPARSLYNDDVMHRKILSSLPSQHYLRVPVCHQYITSQDSLWEKLSLIFPTQFQITCNSLISERIPHFPQEVRERIIDKYCPDQLKATIISSEPDRDCLIRPYLARRRLPPRTDLSLDSALYASIMAEALANLYWKAHIDANDIEFVLAPQSSKDVASASESMNSPFLGNHVMWILDFNCCKTMSMDAEGVEPAVTAFYKNDPFYPRPEWEVEKGQALWTVFKVQFLESSNEILEQGSSKACLPACTVGRISREEGSAMRKVRPNQYTAIGQPLNSSRQNANRFFTLSPQQKI
ncbi:MAG: hypothetical protein Q9223_000515 [Gallowayella weberi]